MLGISAYYHDSAAAVVVDGNIASAMQEERFTRKKHDAAFPSRAIAACLQQTGLTISDLDAVAFYDKPLLKFERLLETYLVHVPRGLRSFRQAMGVWLKEKLWIGDTLRKELGYDGPLYFPEHHHSHAASAFYPSPFQEAAILTMDGVGEWTTTSWGVGSGHRITLESELRFPHSLGLLYSAFTYYCGFKVNSGEYKLMGLAPYGEPVYVDLIRDHLIDIRSDGSFLLNLEYFNYPVGLTMTNRKFHHLFQGPPRAPESRLEQRHMDLARSIQEVTEEIVIRTARHIEKETGQKALCLAGGVALNCVANGKLLREGIFDDIWIQPAAGDAGGALGAALAVWHQEWDHPRTASGKDTMQGSYLGSGFSESEIEAALKDQGLVYTRVPDPTQAGAEVLASGQVLGWFQGAMEYGPRALGNRSILGDPRRPDMQKTMNLKIKYRESFRPFAPSVLEEEVSDWFDLDRPSPYMLLVANVAMHRRHPIPDLALEGLEKLAVERSQIPAVTHVDYTARIQTVSRKTNPLFHELIRNFKALTGCPVVVNTSFNVRGEPIVRSPEEAIRCFLRTEMDVLILGPFQVKKQDQSPAMIPKDRDDFELD
ncbi:MAG: carbamoyltransferase [FCB group bacterium]|nr:carbamoyltransferase [FCB group bacterium]